MNAAKNAIKKLLVGKAEKKYKSALKSKELDYDKWVRALEKQTEFENSSFSILENNQINEILDIKNESSKNEKDRKLAEFNELCKLITIFDEKNCPGVENQYVVCSPNSLPQAIKSVREAENAIIGVILLLYPGQISKNGLFEIHKRFSENKNQILIYGDEDAINEAGKRVSPWYKSDWAPDTFLSYFYFGGLVAIRSQALLSVTLEENLYNTLYKLLLFEGTFSKHKAYDALSDIDYDSDAKVGHIPYILFHSYLEEGKKTAYDYILDMKLQNPLVERTDKSRLSVIIPSKDHPEVLFRCIDSFVEKTLIPDYLDIEIIIVDNGSSIENKTTIESLIEGYRGNEDYSFEYIYDKRDFNFSYMCNTGARNAKGNYLLFLNDDMEIVDKDWIVKLMEKARLPYGGAVGSKLIYPPNIREEGDIIQHAGITNLRIGPAHKLQFMKDSAEHYFGRNRFCHDMMGVTGACLLVKKAIFDEVGGFDEQLAVAFNDVDLCYRIFEAGYYNIERNDTILYHHESLSRGNDSENTEKQKRLNREKDYLYEKHQGIYGKDPFYNINLTTDMLETEYAPRYHYEVKLDHGWGNVENITNVIKTAREDKCVRIGMECAMDVYKWRYGVSKDRGKTEPTEADLGYYFQGYTFVIGSNNACFERRLFLENISTSEVFGIETDVEYRPDIAANVPDQLNVDLAGYTARLKDGVLPKGEYRFGMYMKDRTSGLRLYNYSNWTIVI